MFPYSHDSEKKNQTYKNITTEEEKIIIVLITILQNEKMSDCNTVYDMVSDDLFPLGYQFLFLFFFLFCHDTRTLHQANIHVTFTVDYILT